MVRAICRRLFSDSIESVKIVALLGFIISALGIDTWPQLRLTFELGMVGIAVSAAFVLLIYQKFETAAHMIWVGGALLFFVWCDLTRPADQILCILFAFVCFGLLWCLRPLVMKPSLVVRS